MDAGTAPKAVYYLVRTRSLFSCVLHWVYVLSILLLVLTGFYIAFPMLLYGQGEPVQAYIMGYIRLIHFVAASCLIISFVLRLYLSFFLCNRRDILDIIPTPRNITGALRLAFFYLTLKGPHHVYRYVNPLGGLGIFSMIIFCLIQILTGFLLYLPGADVDVWGWALPLSLSLTASLGGLQLIRLVHHGLMFLLLCVILIHIYMQVWKNAMFDEADMASILAGYKMFPESIVKRFDKGFESWKVS